MKYFLLHNMLIGCFFWVAILGVRVIFGGIPTLTLKQNNFTYSYK